MKLFASFLLVFPVALAALAGDAPAPKPAEAAPQPPAQAQAPALAAQPPTPAPPAPPASEAAAVPAAPINHKIYACPDEGGALVYQDDPCDEPLPKKKRRTIPPPPPAPPAVADVAALGSANEIASSSARPGRSLNAGRVSRTGTAPASSIASRAPRTPAIATPIAAPVEAMPSAAATAEMRAWLDREVEAAGGIAPIAPTASSGSSGKPAPIRLVIDPHAFSSDPRWGSPERTLTTFVAAIRQGDRPAAKACLTAGALADLGTRLEDLAADGLKAEVAGYRRFVQEGKIGPYWSIRALRDNARPKWILFERFGDGTWKISSI